MWNTYLLTPKRGFYRLEPGVVSSSVYTGRTAFPLYTCAIALVCIRVLLVSELWVTQRFSLYARHRFSLYKPAITSPL